MKRILVTGVSGSLGEAVIKKIRKAHPTVKIMGLDTVTPTTKGNGQPDIFVKRDVRNKGLSIKFVEFQPDTVIHLDFDNSQMTDVEGTRNLLDIIGHLPIPPKRLLVTSSAYVCDPTKGSADAGIDEDQIVSQHSLFPQTKEAYETEQMVKTFAKRHKGIHVSWIRPSVMVSNNGCKFLEEGPIARGRKWSTWVDGDFPFQFVHETDVANAIVTIVENNGQGPYHVGPPESIKASELTSLIGTQRVYCPFWLLYVILLVAWLLRCTNTPPSSLNFHRHALVVRPKRLETELNFRFEYTSRGALDDWLDQKVSPSKVPPTQ